MAKDIYKMKPTEGFELNRFTIEIRKIREANTKVIDVTPKAWWDADVKEARYRSSDASR